MMTEDISISNVSGKALDGSDWGRFEVKVSPQDKSILGMLKETGFNGKVASSGTVENLPTLGVLYNSLRTDSTVCARIGLPVLTDDSVEQTKPKGKGGSKKHPPKGVSADEIRRRKIMQTFASQREQFLTSWNRSHWDEIPVAKPNMTIDALVLDLLQHIDGFCKNIATIEKSKVYDLIFGCAKFLENLKVLEVRNAETNKLERVNPLLISDLNTKFEELKKLSRFSIVTAAAENPKFLVKTSYDGVIPNMVRVPYESQVKLINLLNENKENGLFAFLNTPTGEGKTTLIVGIAAVAQSWNRENSTQYEVIYCCSQKLKTIEIQVGQNAWNALIPFGTAVVKRRSGRPDKASRKDNYNCKKLGERRVLTIADISSTILLLKQQIQDKLDLVVEQSKLDELHSEIVKIHKLVCAALRGEYKTDPGELAILKKKESEMREEHTKLFNKVQKLEYDANKQYILCFDEPTVDLDIKDSPMVSYLSTIFTLMPKFTILSTATAPKRESIPWLESIFESKYPGAAVEFIKTSKVRIGSEISDLDGNVFIPHAGCHDVEHFKKVVSIIESDYFLQKCYTSNVVNELFSKLVKLSKIHTISISPELNFKDYLNKTENMNQDAICKLAIKYLRLVVEIASSVDVVLGNAIVSEFSASRFSKRGVNFETLATSANQFESQTLIVTEDPLDFANKYFAAYITKAKRAISKANGFSDTALFDEIVKVFAARKSRYEAAKLAIEEDREKTKVRGIDRAEHEAQRKIRIEALGDSPRFIVPDELVIGSTSYMKQRGASSTLNSFNPESVRWSEIECTDTQQFCLCIGIGFYSRSYSPSYTKVVLDMASNCKLAYLIANDVICYGANYPIENVIVDNTCITPERHSTNTANQVFARAGRPGKSWRANIFAHPSVLDMIKLPIHHPEFVDIEVQNMNKALHHCVLDTIIARKVVVIQDAINTQKRLEREAEKELQVWESQKRALQEAQNAQKVQAALEAEKLAKIAAELKADEEAWNRSMSQQRAEREASEAQETKTRTNRVVRVESNVTKSNYVPPHMRR